MIHGMQVGESMAVCLTNAHLHVDLSHTRQSYVADQQDIAQTNDALGIKRAQRVSNCEQ